LNGFLGNLTALYWETLQPRSGQPDIHQLGNPGGQVRSPSGGGVRRGLHGLLCV